MSRPHPTDPKTPLRDLLPDDPHEWAAEVMASWYRPNMTAAGMAEAVHAISEVSPAVIRPALQKLLQVKADSSNPIPRFLEIAADFERDVAARKAEAERLARPKLEQPEPDMEAVGRLAAKVANRISDHDTVREKRRQEHRENLEAQKRDFRREGDALTPPDLEAAADSLTAQDGGPNP